MLVSMGADAYLPRLAGTTVVLLLLFEAPRPVEPSSGQPSRHPVRLCRVAANIETTRGEARQPT